MTNNIDKTIDIYNQYIDSDIYNLDNLPDGISISTMCTSCKINNIFNVDNIKDYLELDEQNILTVKKSNWNIRTLLNKKKNKQCTKDTNTRHYFFNQITIVIRINSTPIANTKDLSKSNTINLKLFKNGSIQMSGCKSINDINTVLNKLFVKLLDNYYNVNCYIHISDEHKNKLYIKNIDDYHKIKKDINELNNYIKRDKQLLLDNIFKLSEFKIDMINANYKINIQIDRINLYKLLQLKKIKSYYEPCIRACVIIKFIPYTKNKIDEKEISISIFQKGNIIITGARSKEHIVASYNYINNLLTQYKTDIMRNHNIDEEKIIEDVCKEVLNNINQYI